VDGNAKTKTGAQLVVRALEAQGVTHIFGVPGGKILGVFAMRSARRE
jgi:acetolactate synthase I/II/III large subunit